MPKIVGLPLRSCGTRFMGGEPMKLATNVVAGFVGTPPMNFLEGHVVRDGARLAFDEGESRLPIADVHSSKLAQYADKPLVIGIRPEMLSPGSNGAASLKAKVAVVEPLGDRMDVHAGTPRNPHITCRIDARSGVKEG